MQMISLMDKLWQQENMDFRMLPYGCLSTGNEVGMIEVVLNAETVSNIQQKYGGSTAAFRDQPIQEWIRAQNADGIFNLFFFSFCFCLSAKSHFI